MDMEEIKFIGDTFTWANNREGGGSFKSIWIDFLAQMNE